MIKGTVFLTLTLAFTVAIASFWKGDYLNQDQVEKKWGHRQFETASFKNGTLEERAAMAADLMKKKNLFEGKDAIEIRNLLGSFSGHYFSESYPTFLIEKGTETKSESWQLVFLIDRKDKVKDVVVHKNCCY